MTFADFAFYLFAIVTVGGGLMTVVARNPELEAQLRSTASEPQRLVVDFVIHHINKSGAATPKVFKWATVDLGPGERVALSKRRLIRMATTRTYYPGEHNVELQIAGSVAATSSFEVVMDD